MREVLRELGTEDSEHPDAWLEHDTGWSLVVDENGKVVWENCDTGISPRHMLNVPQEQALNLWLKLSQGEIQRIEEEPWQAGNGRKGLSAEEQARIEAITLETNRIFYDSLGPENAEELCAWNGCYRGKVAFSVFCKIHHYENVQKQSCPFDH